MFVKSNEPEQSILKQNHKLFSILRGYMTVNKDDNIYYDQRVILEELELIQRMRKVPDCSILYSGLRLSSEKLPFFYCSCDPNQMYQICKECAISCHEAIGHVITEQPAEHFKCACGESTHKLGKDNLHQYIPRCTFSDTSKIAQINYFYLTDSNKSICSFCEKFCIEKSNSCKIVHVESSNQLPNCRCNSPSHLNVKNIYSFINQLGKSKNESLFKDMKQIQFINLLGKSKDTFQNLYTDLMGDITQKDLIERIAKILKDKQISETNFFYGLVNFTILARKTNGLAYYSKDILNLVPFTDLYIYAILSSKYEDKKSFWNFFDFSLKGYKRITIGYYTKHIPRFKIFDYENMSTLQRLVLMNRNKECYSDFLSKFFNNNNYLTNLFIDALNNIISSRFNHYEAYDALLSIFSILNIAARFFLFTTNQMIKLCSYIDNLFDSLIQIKKKPKYSQIIDEIKQKENKMLLKIIKILHMFIFIFNDRIIFNAIQSTEKIQQEKIKFLNNNTDLGRGLIRNVIKIMTITSQDYNLEKKEELTISNKIIRHGISILSNFSNSKDIYIVSLKRNFDYADYYLQILHNDMMNKDSIDYLYFLNNETKKIESSYDHYLNFTIDKFAMLTQVSFSIDNLYNFINNNSGGQRENNANANANNANNNKNLNINYLNDLMNKSINNKSVNFSATIEPEIQSKRVLLNNRASNNPMQVSNNYERIGIDGKNTTKYDTTILIKIKALFYHSNYIFSLIKLLRVVNLDPEVDRNLITKMYSLIYMYVEDNSDNAYMIFTHNVFKSLKSIHYTLASRNFELFLVCIKTLTRKDELGYSKHIVKKMADYLLKLPDDYEDKYVCLNYFLKICEIFLNGVKCIHYQSTIFKIKEIMKKIINKYEIISDFMTFMINLTTFCVDKKYFYSNIEEFEGEETHELIYSKIVFKLSENERGVLNKITINNSLVFNIFFLSIKIINKVFESSRMEDKLFLSDIFRKKDFIHILKYKKLNLNIRTEIIKFIRKIYMDISALNSRTSSDKYIDAFVNNMLGSHNHINETNNFPVQLYSLYKELITVSDSTTLNANPQEKIDPEIHEFMLNEISNFSDHFENPKKIEPSVLMNYFENGLVIPINLYFKKIFSRCHEFSGEQFLIAFELIPKFLSLKKSFLFKNHLIKFVQESKTYTSQIQQPKEVSEGLGNLLKGSFFRKTKGFNSQGTLIEGRTFTEDATLDITRDLHLIRDKKYCAFDYTTANILVENHIGSMIQRQSSLNLHELFKKVNLIEEINKYEEYNSQLDIKSISDQKLKLYQISYLYQIRKGILDTNFSALAAILNEISFEFECTNRSLVLQFLIKVITQQKFSDLHFSKEANFILFKLLQYSTSETQNELEKLLEEEIHEETPKKHKKLNEDGEELSVSEVKINVKTEHNHHKMGFLTSLCELLFKKLIKVFVIDFNPKEDIYDSNYIEAYNVIKIFKFLCEEHNNFFQGSLIKKLTFFYHTHIDRDKPYVDKIGFFDIMILILNNIIVWNEWTRDKQNPYQNKDYYYDMFFAIVELLIEVIQGNNKENLNTITVNETEEESDDNSKQKEESPLKRLLNTPIQKFILNVNNLLFNERNCEADNSFYSVKTCIMNFIVTILEEKNCSKILKKFIIKNISINRVLTCISNNLKKYFLNKTKGDALWNTYKLKYKLNFYGYRPTKTLSHSFTKETAISGKEYKLLKFDNDLYHYFYDHYFNIQDGLPESCEFVFSNILYKFIKIISIPPYENEVALKMMNKILTTEKSEIINEFNNQLGIMTIVNKVNAADTQLKYDLISKKNNSFDIAFCEYYFVVKFFESVTEVVEVKNMDGENVKIIFTQIPNINCISTHSKVEFLEKVNRENQYTKMYDLMKSVDLFKHEIEYNISKKSSILYNKLKNINYQAVQTIMFLLSIFINIIIISLLDGDTRTLHDYESGSTPSPNAFDNLELYKNHTVPAEVLLERAKIGKYIYDSVFIWEYIYKNLSLALISLCSFFILLYSFFRAPFYYELYIKNMVANENIKRNEISLLTKLKIFFWDVIIGKDHITSLLFLLITNSVAVSYNDTKLQVFYSFGLLTILNINPVLKNISIAIKLKYKELLSTLMMIFILYYANSSIGFYFFKSRFETTLWEKSDNYCESLAFCFFTHSNAGFRIEGGIGDMILDKYMYQRETGTYIFRLIYDFIYFCVMNILMRELAFGIIVETFSELRKEEHHRYHDIEYKCFVCGVTKDDLEKDRINFEDHCEKDHNIWNYIYYLITLKFSDPQDLNAINGHVLDQIDKRYTSWVPSHKTKRELAEKSNKAEEIDLDELNFDKDKYNEYNNEKMDLTEITE